MYKINYFHLSCSGILVCSKWSSGVLCEFGGINLLTGHLEDVNLPPSAWYTDHCQKKKLIMCFCNSCALLVYHEMKAVYHEIQNSWIME